MAAAGSADQSVAPAPAGSADQSRAVERKKSGYENLFLVHGLRTAITSSKSRVDTTSDGGSGGVPFRNFRSLSTSNGGSLGLGLLLLLLLNFIGITVEEHVNHDVPTIGSTRDSTPETENLTGKEPPHETDGVTGLVVGGDSDIDKL